MCTRMLKGEEVIVTCLADGSKEQLHQRKGKLQRLKASLKKQDYDPKRDFVGWGGDGEDVEEFKTIELLAASAPGWRYAPAKRPGDRRRLDRPRPSTTRRGPRARPRSATARRRSPRGRGP